jgi:hypothetical protein
METSEETHYRGQNENSMKTVPGLPFSPVAASAEKLPFFAFNLSVSWLVLSRNR